MARISGPAVAVMAAGGIFAYSAIRGKSALAVVQGLVQGQAPASSAQAYPIADVTAAVTDAAGPAPTPGTLTGQSGSAIASDAVRYAGAGYVWGGAPAGGAGNWDCSSFCNWVIGHDLGLAIPMYKAGTYTGTSHGPTTLAWLAWTGAATVGSDPAAAQPGDLAVWQTHMGICLGGGQMISALNPRLGTRQTSISGGGPGAEVLYVRRLRLWPGSAARRWRPRPRAASSPTARSAGNPR